MRETTGAASKMTATMTSAWVIAATLVRAPARTFTVVRAMAPVAGMPPNMPDAMLARPWPIISRASDVLVDPVMASATLADRRLSMAARMATATAGPKRRRTTVGLSVGTAGRKSWWGSAPMVGTAR